MNAKEKPATPFGSYFFIVTTKTKPTTNKTNKEGGGETEEGGGGRGTRGDWTVLCSIQSSGRWEGWEGRVRLGAMGGESGWEEEWEG